MSRPAMILLAALALGAGLAAADPATAGPDADPMRASLRRLDAPWYDAKLDSWRRVEMPERRPPPADEGKRSDGGALGSVLGMLIYALVAATIAWLLWVVVRTWRAQPAPEPDAARPAPMVDLKALPFQLAVRQHGEPELALAAALAAGDWTLAAMWIYAIQLLRLDRSGAIRLVPGKTNRAYAREVRAAPAPVRSALASSVAVFERSFFGHQPVDEATVRELQRHHLAFEAELARDEARP